MIYKGGPEKGVSQIGKEATIGILNAGDFFREDCLTGRPLRLCSATAITDCSVMRIGKKSTVEVDSSRTCVLRTVRRVFAGTEHPSVSTRSRRWLKVM